MSKDSFPHPTSPLALLRKQLAPEIHDAFAKFNEQVFAERAGRTLATASIFRDIESLEAEVAMERAMDAR